MVAVGDEQLELQRLEVVLRHARAGEAVEDDEQRVDLPQLAEQLRPGPGTSTTRTAAGVTLRACTTSRELVEPRVGDLRHADVAVRAARR